MKMKLRYGVSQIAKDRVLKSFYTLTPGDMYHYIIYAPLRKSVLLIKIVTISLFKPPTLLTSKLNGTALQYPRESLWLAALIFSILHILHVVSHTVPISFYFVLYISSFLYGAVGIWIYVPQLVMDGRHLTIRPIFDVDGQVCFEI